ncbi:hypothetical protein MJO28_017154, partial [Puccinia striiformis f. sp. tritici]
NDSSRSCTSILSFTDILSRVPAVREDDLIVITSSEGGKKLVVKSDKELLEDKIMEALATGDKASSTGALPAHMEIGFTPYFDKALKTLNAHKANINQIIADYGFLTGFRYDIIVHQNMFSVPVPQPDASKSVPQISIFRQEIKDKAYELHKNWNDNPHAPNCPKFNWDLKTVKAKAMKNKKFDNKFGAQKDHIGGGRGRGGYRGRGRWHGRSNNQDH